MKLNLILKIIFVFTIFSCNESKKDNDEINITNQLPEDFNVFKNKFEVLKLPLKIEPLKLELDKYVSLNESDLKFINSKDLNSDLDKVFAFGILPDTIDSYKIVYLYPYEYYVPFLVTYSKNGKKVSEVNLSVGGCGSDCGFFCSDYVKIYSDYSIHSVDSIRNYECDSLGIVENTLRKIIRHKKGKVNKKGIITFSEIMEENK